MIFERFVKKQRQQEPMVPHSQDWTMGNRLKQLTQAVPALHAYLRHGNTEQANTLCEQIQNEVNELAGQLSEPARQLSLARIGFDLGLALRQLGKDDSAAHCLKGTLRLSMSACSGLEMANACRIIAACHNYLGLIHLDAGDNEQGERCFRQALAVRERFRESYSTDPENLIYLGGVLCNLGHSRRNQGALQDSLVFYLRSIDILEQSIPGCECGCRDLHDTLHAHSSGVPTSTQLAQQFLINALQGRATTLASLEVDRFRNVHCYEQAGCTIISILQKQQMALSIADAKADLSQTRTELLDAIAFASGPIVFELHTVEAIDMDLARLLLHLRTRIIGAGHWPMLCCSKNVLHAAVPTIDWESLFHCYATVKDAIADKDRAGDEPQSAQRRQIIELLQLFASEEQQLEYERNVQVDITAEMIHLWFGAQYDPKEPYVASCFSTEELAVLETFHHFYGNHISRLPESEGTVRSWLASPAWREVMEQARDTLQRINF